MHRADRLADGWFLVSGFATISAWQENLDWALKIVAFLVAIAAGLLSILIRWRAYKNKKDSTAGLD